MYLYENWVSKSSDGFYEFIVHAVLEFAYHMHSYGSACIYTIFKRLSISILSVGGNFKSGVTADFTGAKSGLCSQNYTMHIVVTFREESLCVRRSR